MTRFARPFGAARSLRARSVQLAAPVVEPRSGVLIPLGLGDTYKQKARTSVQALNLNMAVRWAAIFTFIIIRVNHNYFFIYNVLSLFFVRWCIAIFL